MTRKDYEMIAKGIHATLYMHSHTQEAYYKLFVMTVEHLAAAFEYDNPRFNRAKFMEACGVQNCTQEV